MYIDIFCKTFRGTMSVLAGLAAVAVALVLVAVLLYLVVVLIAWMADCSKKRRKKKE